MTGTKRPRDEDSAAATDTSLDTSKFNEKADVATQEEDGKLKKQRQETPPKMDEPTDDDEHHDSDPVDDVDAEAALMRALEEAIDKDTAEAKKGAIPMIVDEDDDYDESD